jgi:HAD superfamily hydrolase (TIGR01450 family)
VNSGLIGCPNSPAEVYDLVLLDLDGVVYIGPAAVPGAAQALDRIRAVGVRTAFVTNNASRPPEVVADHLRELGVAATEDDVVNSAQAAAALLARRLPAGAAVLVVGGLGLYRALEEVGLKPVGKVDDGPAAVVQGFGPDVGWRLLAEGSRAVRAGLPWIATNTDLTVPTAYGPAPGNGTLVAAIATATGATPEVAGKPQPTLFLEAAERYGARRPLVVGDRLDTDLEGARAANLDGLAVLTGVHRIREILAAPANQRPHLIARDLFGLLEAHPAPEEASEEASAGESAVAGVKVRDAVVRVAADGLRVVETGADALDLARAGLAAAWAFADASPDATGAAAPADPLPPVDPAPLLEALYRLDEGGPWGR